MTDQGDIEFSEAIKLKKNDIFLGFTQNFDCGCTLELPWRGMLRLFKQVTCIRAKIRKIGTGVCLYSPALLHKNGV